jgi:hypothetical protein
VTARIWFYSTLIIVFTVINMLVIRSGRVRVHCSSCVTPMSARRRSLFRVPWAFGGWVCPHCGTRMDRAGRSLSEGAAAGRVDESVVRARGEGDES